MNITYRYVVRLSTIGYGRNINETSCEEMGWENVGEQERYCTCSGDSQDSIKVAE